MAEKVSLEELAVQARHDHRAFEELLGRVDRGCWLFANKYQRWLPVRELHGYAQASVMSAVRNYSPEKGKFFPYLWGWLRAACTRAMETERKQGLVGVGRSGATVVRMRESGARFSDIARSVGLSRVEAFWKYQAHRTRSLNTARRSTAGGAIQCETWQDLLPAEGATPEQALIARDAFRTLLACMPPRLMDILVRRVLHEETLTEIGEDYGVSQERIRQLQCEAIAEARKVLEL